MVAAREAEEEATRQQRAEEREKRLAKKKAAEGRAVTMTPASVRKTQLEKMLEKLDRIHRRVD